MSGDDHNNTTETRAWVGCDNTMHVCSCAFWANGGVEHDDDCNIWLNDRPRGEVAP